MSKEQTSKKYRCYAYDDHDTFYADKVKIYFSSLENNVKDNFMLYTDDLMNENQINRFELLRAIDDFEKNEKQINEKNHNKWLCFVDMAFNFRPYQPCSVM